jgi:hypothetical protein
MSPQFRNTKGSIEIREIMLLLAAIVFAAAFILVWTQGLPVEKQTIPTDFT